MSMSEMLYDESAAYRNAVDAAIRNNREKGWKNRTPDHAAITAYVNMRAESGNEFYKSIWNNFNHYGSMSEKVCDIVRRDIAKQSERKAAMIAADSKSMHVGTIGVRQDFTLTIRATTSFETDFGMCFLYIMADQSGNIVVYKGQNLGYSKGETVTGKATVKAHTVRETINQTIISRPKFDRK